MTTDATIVWEKPNQTETLDHLRRLHTDYQEALEVADAARAALHEAVRDANRVHGIKQETIGEAIGGVTKSRVYAIIDSLDKAEEDSP